MIKKYYSLYSALFVLSVLLAYVLLLPCAAQERELSPPSNEGLRQRISLLEEALVLREYGERMEQEGSISAAALSFRKSYELYPDPMLAESIMSLQEGSAEISSRPGLDSLRQRIALLEELIAGLEELERLLDVSEDDRRESDDYTEKCD